MNHLVEALRGAADDHLIALKLLARDDVSRPQDLAGLNAFPADATDADVAETRRAIALITERGFNRNRDLAAALEDVRSET